MNDQLIYEISGNKYILIEVAVTLSDDECKQDHFAMVKKYGMLYQGVKKVNRGIFNTDAIYTYLIPEERYLEFAQ